MSNIPNFEQWGKMNDYLNSIAVSLGSKVDTSTWVGVQKAVRLGLAPDLFPIGTQLKVNHSIYGELLYDVVAHDYLRSTKNENAHTMTLLCHDSIGSLQLDEAEAFYCAESEVPAGTYNFKIPYSYVSWTAGTYQFTLTQALPVGGQLCISGYSSDKITTLKVVSYASRTTTTPTETVAITSGSEGTSLGTFGVELNHIHRVSDGSDNYKESAIRQFLNSSAEAGSVWSPQTKFDRPPNWMVTMAGFMNGLDEDFLAVVGDVIVPCASNNSYESPDSTVTKNEKYTVIDKFYLASQQEVFGIADDTVVDDSVLFPFYKNATSIDYLKYKGGLISSWVLRSAQKINTSYWRFVYTDGLPHNLQARHYSNCVPACTIV
jgi:hypothetical protein